MATRSVIWSVFCAAALMRFSLRFSQYSRAAEVAVFVSLHVSVQRFTSTTTPQIGGAEWLGVEPLGRAAERGQMHTFEQDHH